MVLCIACVSIVIIFTGVNQKVIIGKRNEERREEDIPFVVLRRFQRIIDLSSIRCMKTVSVYDQPD